MWHLNFFGGLRARRQERTIERFRTQKTAALLALLALRGSRSREDICALLWPDASPEAARNSLSAALSALRRDLGDDVVCADRVSVALAPSAFQTDVSLFDDALKMGDIAPAVELYRGHLLPGFYEDPFPSLEREYQEKARTAFKTRLEELEDNGEAAEALELARRAASLFGDEERWFLGFMRAHYGLGDLDAALRAYDALGRFMRKNGDTSSETARVLAKAIRRDKEIEASTPTPPTARRTPEPARAEVAPIASADASSASSVKEELPVVEAFRNNLPTQWTRFFGRETERTTLAHWLEGGQKLVTLSGAGGSGKTRLSLETLRGLAPTWEGDIVFVPLASIEEADLIVPAIRDTLGLTGTPDLSPLEQVERALQGRRALIFLDNFEQLVEGGAPRLQTLRERLPQASFLVTSRVLLQLPGEREFPVSPLPTPLRNTSPSEVRDCASAALFCDRSGLVLDENNAESVGALCRRLDGIPLALELAAARAKVMSPTQILERLQKHPDFLQSRELGIPARHKTLRATIEWSTDLLPPDLRSFWTRLSLFHGGWTLDAAEKVASPGICEDWETLDWLTLLRECSLLFVEDREGEPRFRMLQTLREFGREQLQDSAQVEHAFFDFYLDLAQKAASAMQGPGQTMWLARLDAEQDNLRAALTYARDFEPERGLLLATALIDFWETRLSLDEGRGWIETFLRATAPEKTAPPKTVAAPSSSPTTLDARVRALSGAGRMASHSLDMNESRTLVEQGLQVAQQSGDVSSFIYAVSSFARFAMTTGDAETDLARGRELVEESLRLARQSNDQALLGEALLSTVYLRMSASDLSGLSLLNLEAISVMRQLKDEANLSRLLSNLAHIAYFEKNWDDANELLDESTQIARSLTSPWPMLEALWTRSNVAREEGRLDVARATIIEEWELCRDNPSLLWARVLNVPVIGYLQLREGNPVGAVRLWGAAEKLRESAGFQIAPVLRGDYTRYCDQARSLLGNARFESLWKEGRGLSVQQAVDAVLLEVRESESEELAATRARALSGAGRMAWYGGDLQDAQSKLSQGLDAARQAGDSSVLINATRSSALASTAYGDALQARNLGREGVRLARESGDSGLLLKALMDLGFAEINVSDFAASEAACLEAIALARREGDERALAMTMATLAIAYNYLHRYEEANALLAESEALSRRLGAIYELMVVMSLRGHIASILNHHDEARAIFHEVLPIARDTISNSWTLINMLLSVAYSFDRRGDARGCARILGACESLAQSINYQLMPFLLPDYEHFRDGARRVLGEDEFLREWRTGALLSFEQTITFILEQNEVPLAENPDLAIRARALSGAGRMAWHDGDFKASRALVNQGLDVSRKAGDISSFADAVGSFVRLTTASDDLEGDAAEGRRMAEESVRLSRAAGNKSLLAESLVSLAFATMIGGQMTGMRSVLGEAMAISRELGDDIQLATAITSLATVAYFEEQFDESLDLVNQSIEIARRLDSRFHLYSALLCTANASREQGDLGTSAPPAIEILQMSLGNVPRSVLPYGVFCASYLLMRLGDIPSGAQLLGAAQTLGEQMGHKMLPSYRLDFERYHVLAHEILGEADFEDCWRAGAKLTLPQAVSLALARLEENSPETPNADVATRIRELRAIFKLPSSEPSSVATTSSNELQAARARALSGAGRLAWYGGDMREASALFEQGMSAAQEIGDAEGIASATRGLTRTASVEGNPAKARELAAQTVAVARAEGNRPLLIKSLIEQAFTDVSVRQFESARASSGEAATLSRQSGDESLLPMALNIGAITLSHDNRAAESLGLLRESEAVSRRLGSVWNLQIALTNKAYSLAVLGEHTRAQEDFNEAFALMRESFIESWTVANSWFGVAYSWMRRGDVLDAAQIMGAAEAMRERIGFPLMPLMQPDQEMAVALAQRILGVNGFTSALQKGAAMTPDEVFNFVIRSRPDLAPHSNATSPDEILAARARALSGAGRLAWYASNMNEANTLLEQGLSAAQELGDTEGIVYATRGLMRTAAAIGDSDKSRQVAREALSLARASGDKSLLIKALLDQAYADVNVAELESASTLSSEATVLARQVGDEAALSLALNIGAIALSYQNHDKESLLLLEQSEEIARRVGSAWDLLVVLSCKGHSLSRIGEDNLAQVAVNECLALCRESFSESWTVANCLVAASYVLMRRGEIGDGAQVMGGAEAMRERIGYQWMPVMMPDHEKFVALAREKLGNAEFDAALERGRVMALDEIFNFAIRPVFAQLSPFSHLSEESLATRSRALSGAGRLAWLGSDFEASRAHIYQGLESARESGDLPSFVTAVAAFVRFAMVTGDMDGIMAQSHLLAEEAVERSRRASDKTLLLESLTALAYTHTVVSRFKEAQNTNEEAIALARELGDETRLVRSLNNQVSVFFYQGDIAAARPIAEESLPRCRYLNSTWELTTALWTYSAVLREQGDLVLADQFITEAMELCRANPAFRWGIFTVMTTMGYLFVRRGAVVNGVRLMGASEALRQTFGYAIVPVLRPELERFKGEALAALGRSAFDQAWKEGRVMTTADAMELALRRDETTFLRDTTSISKSTTNVSSGTRSDEIQAARSRALSGAGRLAWHDNDIKASRDLVIEGLKSAREVGDTTSFVYAASAFVRFTLSSNDIEGIVTEAKNTIEEAVNRSRDQGDKALLLDALISLGYATCNLQFFNESYEANQEAIALARELEDETSLVRVLVTQGAVHYYRGEAESARVFTEECVAIARRINSPWDLIAALWIYSGILRLEGHLEQADAAISEVFEIRRANPSYRWSLANVLMMMSYLFADCGDYYHAVCLMSASEAVGSDSGYYPSPAFLPEYERYKTKAKGALGEDEFIRAWKEGHILTPEAAIDLGLRRDETTFTHDSTNASTDEVLAARSRALSGAGRLAVQGSDLEASRALVNQGLKAARESGDAASFVYAVAAFVRFAMVTGDVKGAIAQSRLLAEEAVARSRRENNPALLLESLVALGYATCIISKFKEAYAANEEAIALARELGDETNLVRALNSQVYVYYHQGIYPPARVILEESLELSRRINSTNDLISTLWALSGTAREQGELELAGTAVSEFLEICHANPAFRWGLSHALQSVSYLLVKRGDSANATRLLAASQAINETLGYYPMPVLMVDYERYKTQAQENIGADSFQRAWEEGRVLSVEAAIALAHRLLASWSPLMPPTSENLSDEVLAARSRALSGAGRLAWQGSDLENSRTLVHEGLEAARRSGDVASLVYAVAAFVRFAMVTGDIKGFIAQSRLLSEEAVARSRREGNKALLLDSLISLGYATSIVSQFRESYVANDEAITLARELGDQTNLVRALNNQGTVYYQQGLYAPARLVLEESTAICRRLNSTWDLIASQWTFSSVAREQGNLDLADNAISEVLDICRSNPSFRWGVSNVLMTVSYLFVERDDARTATRLMAASEAINEALSYHPVPVLLTDYERYKAKALGMLGKTTFDEAWEEGRNLTIESAIELALRR